MNDEKFNQLVQKYRDGELTGEQKALMDQWFDKLGVPDKTVWTDAELNTIGRKIREGIQTENLQRNPSSVRTFRHWLPYAAAVLFVAVLVGYFAVVSRQSLVDSRQSLVDIPDTAEIQPGGNRATLTLADGRTIDLSEGHEGIIVGDGITYLDGSEVLEQGKDSSHTGLTTYDLQLTTPRGGQYQVTLPDGTNVSLNSASTLKYPARFEGKQRQVELDGEAYFEVQSGSTPFMVRTFNQDVEVLGTAFNITAYADESDTKTTLVTGSVNVSNRTSNVSRRLMPGQESIITAAEIQVRKANIEAAIAWQSGVFYFDDIPFQKMMKQISRWYNIDVRYDGEVPTDHFSGKMSRNVTLQVLLDFLKDWGIRFRMENDILIVIN